MKKFKGIIPEVKMSEIGGSNYHIGKLEPYNVISVNTNSLFKGNLDMLKRLRAKFPKKFIIRKDFITISKQIKESKEAGADAVLLLRDFLTSWQYDILLSTCTEENIMPITEVHSRYHPPNPKIIGPILVNSRNLNNGRFYRKQATEICKAFKEGGKNVIYASGENSDRVIKKGIADAVLIGTAFMKGKLK